MGQTNNLIGNGDGDNNVRSLEEEIYWSNFKSMRFFHLLSADSLNQLMIPKKFSDNMRDKLPQTMVLRGPGGATSEVQLVRDNNGTLFLKDGWKEFARAHRLKENDMLMFKYKRDSCFKVWIFDKRNLCENAGSYFVTKSDPQKQTVDGNSLSKRKTRENSSDVVVEEEDSGIHGSGSEWAPAGTSKRNAHNRKPICGLRNIVVEDKSLITSNVPNRRPPSAEDKEKALQMAINESTKETFLVVLKAPNVSQYFRLNVPSAWARDYLARKNQDVEFRLQEKSWSSRYNTQSRCGGGVIVTGWYNFVTDNSLQESDVCLFKLVSQIGEPAVIDVRIFYAGEVVTQPS